MNFKVSNVRLESVPDSNGQDFDMVFFDLTTELGTIALAEFVDVCEDGHLSVERVDSCIKCHQDIESVFEDGDVPFLEVIDQVEELLNAQYV